MDVNIIIYIAGCGGNFLSRALTLDSGTIALGNGEYEHIDTPTRFEQYSYRELPQLPVRKDDRATWWQWELKHTFPLRRVGVERLLELPYKIVEAQHPEYFENLLHVFSPADNLKLFYIDITDAVDWLFRQQIHKTGCNGYDMGHITHLLGNARPVKRQLASQYHMQPIYLKKIIESKQSFLQEYQRICKQMDIQPQVDYAGLLYDQWVRTWG